MNYIISTGDRPFYGCLWSVVLWKNRTYVSNVIEKQFYPNFRSIYYFYQHEQPKFSTIERKVNNFFTKFSGFKFISQLENCLLLFDDSCEEIFSMTYNFQNLQLPDAIETLV